jgi:hypothetical protein
MFHATPVLGKDKTRWPIGNATVTKSHPSAAIFAGLAAWAAAICHRVGERLFMSCDEEACWRGWEITELCGGLGRSYRDPRFNARRPHTPHFESLDGES